MNRALFFDRDGVISKVILRDGQPFSSRSFDDFELVDGVRGILDVFKKRNFINIIVTNQPDIARGLMKNEELEKMHCFMRKELPVDDIFVCPHDDIDDCNCRKPKPGMLLAAARKWNIDLNRSFMIGDSWRDIEAGRTAGCTTILVDRPYNKGVNSGFRINNLSSIFKIILEDKKES